MTEYSVKKIKSYLRFFVGMTIAAVVAFSTWDIYTGHSDAITLAERQSADYARALAEHTESAFAEADGMLRDIIHDLSLKKGSMSGDPLSLYHELRRQYENSAQIGALFLVDKDGTMFNNTQEYPPRKISVADRDYFQHYLTSTDSSFTIGKPVMSRLVNRWRFNLMRPLNKPGEPFNGIAAAAIEVDYFKRFLSQASLGPRGRVLLVRTDGVPLVIQPYTENTYQTDFNKTAIFQDKLPQNRVGTYHVADSAVDTSSRILSYNRLGRFPVVAIVSLHKQDVLAAWKRKASVQLSLTFALCSLILLLTRTIIRHLDKLHAVQLELKERSALLASSLNEQRIILNNVSVGISFIKNRSIQWANAQHDRMLGCEPGETGGMATSRFYADSEECLRIDCDGYSTLGSGGIFSSETTMKRADGTTFPCLLAGQAIDPENPQGGSIWVIQDISEIKTAEAERLTLLEEVQHARHLENLGTLAGGIAHDFNNLLMVIQGAADLSKMKLELQSPVRPYLERINQATQSAAELCQKMLVFSGKGQYVLEKIHLKTVVYSVSDQIREQLIRSGISLSLNIPDGLPLIKADPNQIRQAITSIVNNAVEAIGSQQGNITISAMMDTTGAGRNIILEISDTGCGMEEETLRRIFDPFFSTKFLGRGLNMSAVSGVISALKGSIDIKSEMGKGTLVRISIPPYNEEVGLGPVVGTLKQNECGGKPTILFVDDECALREIADDLLDALGYRVLTAISGKEALHMYAEQGDSINLLMLDTTMLKKDGTDVLYELRQRGAKIPVLLSSGYGQEDEISKTVRDDLTTFIRKPYTVEQLQKSLDGILHPVT